jgi:hypothetical protein
MRRKRSAPNRADCKIEAIAKSYAHGAIAVLAQLAGLIEGKPAESELARIAACRELLDRAYGRSTTILAGNLSSGIETHVQSESADNSGMTFTWAGEGK